MTGAGLDDLIQGRAFFERRDLVRGFLLGRDMCRLTLFNRIQYEFGIVQGFAAAFSYSASIGSRLLCFSLFRRVFRILARLDRTCIFGR